MDKTIVIAEAGVNHNGSLENAKLLIDAAVAAEADFVKFQTFRAENIVSKEAKKAEYQISNTGDLDSNQFNMLKSLELSEEDHYELIDYCGGKINFFSTAFDLNSLDYLNSLGFEMFKVPSGELTNYPYIKRVAQFGKPVVLSTGMANMKEIEGAMQLLLDNGLDKEFITVLHCNTEYPTPMEDVNLKAMTTISESFNVKVGYSDHTLGIEVPIAAVALGARIIEKHFTLSRNMTGPDHMASLEPEELKAMVAGIRNIEMAISGDGNKVPSSSEKKNIPIARKSIHIARDLQKGHILGEDDLIPLRPGDGISPMEWNNIIGKKINHDLRQNYKLRFEDLD